MTKGRDAAAESIGNLLEVTRAQRSSGMLRVEYSQRGLVEEGEIYVLAGQPIYACAGELVGNNAMRHLLSWRNIYFAFISDVPQPKANLTPTARVENTPPSMVTLAPPPPPLQPPSMPRSLPTTGKLSRNPAEEPGYLTTPREIWPGMDQVVPQKVGPERDPASLTLTRRQRLIYFLVDGRRSVNDLARCANKNVQDVGLILAELQAQGLITL